MPVTSPVDTGAFDVAPRAACAVPPSGPYAPAPTTAMSAPYTLPSAPNHTPGSYAHGSPPGHASAASSGTWQWTHA